MSARTRPSIRRALLDPLLRDLASARTDPGWQAPGGNRWLAAIGATALLLAALLYAATGPHGLFQPINALGYFGPDALWASLTSLGGTLTALVPALVFARRYPGLLWALLIALLVGGGLSHGLKELLDTARPPAVLDGGSFHLIGPAYQAHSTPSGHTITAFTLACIAIRFARTVRWRAAWVIAAALVGTSRVIVGVHWPLDVLLGAATGAFAAWLTLLIADAWRVGLRPLPHLLLVAFWCLLALALLVHGGDYAAARPLGILLAAGALATAFNDYVLAPLRAANAGRLRHDSD